MLGSHSYNWLHAGPSLLIQNRTDLLDDVEEPWLFASPVGGETKHVAYLRSRIKRIKLRSTPPSPAHFLSHSY